MMNQNLTLGKTFLLLVTARGDLLIQERFDTAAQAEAAGYRKYFRYEERDVYVKRENFALVGAPFAPEVRSDRLTIEVPMHGLNARNIENLRKMVLAKEPLIKKPLEAKKLPIIVSANSIQFPWFPADQGNNAECYAQFIYNLVETAREKKWVLAQPQDYFPNEKFALWTWLSGLGLIGKEYIKIRRLMRKNLTGSSGQRYYSLKKSARALKTAKA